MTHIAAPVDARTLPLPPAQVGQPEPAVAAPPRTASPWRRLTRAVADAHRAAVPF